MPRHLVLRENEPPRPVDLTQAEADALAAAELAAIQRAPGSQRWEIAAGSKVGVVRVGNLQVTVQPKIPISRLLFLVGYARRPNHWRDLPVELDPDTDLPDALAHAFAYWARRALEQGLLQGYLTVAEALPVLRGRIRVGDQLARRRGRALPLEVTYDDFTIDIADNRLLLAAALRLLSLPQVSPLARRALQRIRLLLSDVTPVPRGAVLPQWTPSWLNTRYQPALQLADLVLAGDSFEQRVGDLRVSGFVFDMWRIFEDFVCIALKQAMLPFGGRSSFQQRLHLDEAREIPMKPDFLWAGRDGRRLVVDSKYKAEKPDGFPNADLYQLLAYCTVLSIPDGASRLRAGQRGAASPHGGECQRHRPLPHPGPCRSSGRPTRPGRHACQPPRRRGLAGHQYRGLGARFLGVRRSSRQQRFAVQRSTFLVAVLVAIEQDIWVSAENRPRPTERCRPSLPVNGGGLLDHVGC